MAFPAAADVLRISPAGDSLTNGYAGTTGARLRQALDDRRVEASIGMAAISGATAREWINGGGLDLVSAADPDAVILMLGTNDAARIHADPGRELRVADYQAAMTDILDALAEMDVPVVLSTLIPIREPYEHHELAYTVILEDLNPWIRQQASIREDVTLWDAHDLLLEQRRWSSWYSDGIHLWGDGTTGYDWMAESAADHALLAVPEPMFAPLAVCLLLLRRRRHAREQVIDVRGARPRPAHR